MKLQAIDHEQIYANPSQPRKLFDTEALEELAASISHSGLLQPLVVRPHGNGYQLIAGERRWRACAIANRTASIPCNVVESISDEEAFVLSVTENVARVDMTIMEEARAYGQIVSLGRTHADVAALFGKTVDHIRFRVDLLNLRDDLQHLAERGEISKWVAWSLSKLSLAGQADSITRIVAGEFTNDRDACRYMTAVRQREAQTSMFAADDETLELVTAARKERRTEIEKARARLEELGSTLRPLLETSPEELAETLGSDAEEYKDLLTALLKTVRRAQTNVSNAAALHRATAATSQEAN